MTRLSIAQRAVLDLASKCAPAPINALDALRVGGNGRTLKALADAGYLVKRWHAGGWSWEITDAGEAALKAQKP